MIYAGFSAVKKCNPRRVDVETDDFEPRVQRDHGERQTNVAEAHDANGVVARSDAVKQFLKVWSSLHEMLALSLQCRQ